MNSLNKISLCLLLIVLSVTCSWAADYNYYLPYYSSVDGDWTGLALSNGSTEKTASIDIVVRHTNGDILTKIDKELSASGKTSFSVNDGGANHGWINILSDQPLSGLAFVGHNYLMANIPFVDGLERNLVIPHIAQDNAWDTTIMLCNPSDESVSVKVINVNDQGGMVTQKSLTLVANGSGSYLLSDLFDGIVLAGKIYLQATSKISAFALYSDMKNGGNYFAGINAVAENYIVKYLDLDGDGYTSDVDCNDNDATINPGAVDVCGDGIDQDCTGYDTACGKEGASYDPHAGYMYDVVKYGLPKFVTTNYIELSKVFAISKFRSGAGHDYSDNFEDCRSMKHYFFNLMLWEGAVGPKPDLNVGYPKIYSPVDGVVTEIHPEWFGYQVHIRSTEYPAFLFIIFHVQSPKNLKIGDNVVAGEEIGENGPDIAVEVATPTGTKFISFLDVITNDVFREFQLRGVRNRSDAIISKEARDLDSLICDENHNFVPNDDYPSFDAGYIENYIPFTY